MDEPIHIAAGLSYLDAGRIVLNPEHPPLLKEISGIFLRVGRIHWPDNPQATALLSDPSRPNGTVVNAIIADNGPDRVLFWSRLPFILLSTILLFALYFFGRLIVGNTAAIAAVLLYAVDPTVLAHSFLVTTDGGVTLFIILFLLAFWRYLQRPSWHRALWCGVSLGAALGAKFSAVVLLPIAAVLIVGGAIWPIEAVTDEQNAQTSPNALCSCGSGKKYKHCHGNRDQRSRTTISDGVRRRLLQYGIAFAAMCAVAILLIQIFYFFPKDPFQYLAGMRAVNTNHDPDFQAYMAGRLSHRFYSYYLIAYLLKEPLATIILTAIGFALLLRNRTMQQLALLFLLFPLAALFVGYTFWSDNIGIRYILPVLPFTHLVGGVGTAALLGSGLLWKRAQALFLGIWLIAAAVGIYPDHLSYFNEAACLLDNPRNIGTDGGSRCGPSWLDENNVDWGQGLKQLKVWLDHNAKGQRVRLAYFGPFPPENYGIKFEMVEDEDLLTGRRPGLYAVSSHIVASTPAVVRAALGSGAEWLRTTRPIAVVGHAFYIYEVPSRPTSP